MLQCLVEKIPTNGLDSITHVIVFQLWQFKVTVNLYISVMDLWWWSILLMKETAESTNIMNVWLDLETSKEPQQFFTFYPGHLNFDLTWQLLKEQCHFVYNIFLKILGYLIGLNYCKYNAILYNVPPQNFTGLRNYLKVPCRILQYSYTHKSLQWTCIFFLDSMQTRIKITALSQLGFLNILFIKRLRRPLHDTTVRLQGRPPPARVLLK